MTSPAAFPHLEVTSTGEGTVVTLIDCPFLDELTTQTVGEELLRLLVNVGSRRVFLSLANVERLISSTLSLLLTVHHTLRSGGGQLIVCNVPGAIDEVFEVTRLKQVIEIRSEAPPGAGQTNPGENPTPPTGTNGPGGPM